MNDKTNFHVQCDRALVEQAKSYKMNLSKTVEDAIKAKLLLITPFKKRLEAKEENNTCAMCQAKIGWAKLFGVLRDFNRVYADQVLCQPCLSAPYKGSSSLEEYLIIKLNRTIKPMGKVIESEAEFFVKNDFKAH